MDLRLNVKTQSERRAVVAAQGRVNGGTARAMRAQIRQLVDEGLTEIILDLTGVDLLDSSGLSALVEGLKTARERSGSLKLAGLSPQVASIFKLTMLDHIFEMYPSVGAVLDRNAPAVPMAKRLGAPIGATPLQM